jgi:hypothetical protein
MIRSAVPDASIGEVLAASRAVAEETARSSSGQMRRLRNATTGNAGKVAQPGDGTLPFAPRAKTRARQ